jgi:HD-GYP domain-containing protein (c-di-GMP phosphodiesterase class II)
MAHHETWDDYGHPDQLRGEQLPQLSRISAVCDSWDAMTEDRCYRKGMTAEYATQVIREGAGFQWDAELIEVLLSLQAAL